MGYITMQTLTDRFGADEITALADRDRDGVADTGVVDQAITDASAEVDSYLGTRYSVPLETAPAVVQRLCADIARYRLMDERPLDEAVKRYDDAVRFLRDIAAGKASLGLPTEGDGAEASPIRYAAKRGRDDRTFTRESLEGY